MHDIQSNYRAISTIEMNPFNGKKNETQIILTSNEHIEWGKKNSNYI